MKWMGGSVFTVWGVRNAVGGLVGDWIDGWVDKCVHKWWMDV